MRQSSMIHYPSSIPTGFTLVEAVAALAVAALALTSLLHLQLLGIRTAEHAQTRTQAVLLAQQKMAETLSAGYPPLGVRSGRSETAGAAFAWRLEVTEARTPLPVAASARPAARAGPDRLRRLSVEVTWPHGPGNRQIQLTTLVAQNTSRGA